MDSRLRKLLQRAAYNLMLAAAIALLWQGVLTATAQAAAVLGSMPQSAVMVSGQFHFHGPLARLIHFHNGDNTPGHVHHPHDDADENGVNYFWSFGCASAVMPPTGIVSASFDLRAILCTARLDAREGVEPDGLQRPPSTPGIG